MSKTHISDTPDDLDAALDDFIKTKKTKQVVSSVGTGVDIFGDGTVKKKSFRQIIAEWWHQLFLI